MTWVVFVILLTTIYACEASPTTHSTVSEWIVARDNEEVARRKSDQLLLALIADISWTSKSSHASTQYQSHTEDRYFPTPLTKRSEPFSSRLQAGSRRGLSSTQGSNRLHPSYPVSTRLYVYMSGCYVSDVGLRSWIVVCFCFSYRRCMEQKGQNWQWRDRDRKHNIFCGEWYDLPQCHHRVPIWLADCNTSGHRSLSLSLSLSLSQLLGLFASMYVPIYLIPIWNLQVRTTDLRSFYYSH